MLKAQGEVAKNKSGCKKGKQDDDLLSELSQAYQRRHHKQWNKDNIRMIRSGPERFLAC